MCVYMSLEKEEQQRARGRLLHHNNFIMVVYKQLYGSIWHTDWSHVFEKKEPFLSHTCRCQMYNNTQLYSRKTLLISHSVRIVKHIAGVINKSISSRALCKLTLTLTKKSFKRQMHWISDPTRGSPLFFSLYEKIGWVPCKKGELWGVEHTIHIWTYKCICQYTFRVELFSVMKWPAVVPLRYESFLHFPFMRTFVGGSLPQTWNPPL